MVFVSAKPGSYLLRMQMRYECWRHKFAINNSQGLSDAQLSCEYCSENRIVTSNSCQLRIAFAIRMNRALCWFIVKIKKIDTTKVIVSAKHSFYLLRKQSIYQSTWPYLSVGCLSKCFWQEFSSVAFNLMYAIVLIQKG